MPTLKSMGFDILVETSNTLLDTDSAWGTASYGEQKITLLSRLAPQERIQVMFHELIEFWIHWGIVPRKLKDHGEAPLNRLAVAMADLIRNNAWLIEETLDDGSDGSAKRPRTSSSGRRLSP